ncbi:uncharacterized protein CYBJADRAFT_168143, partial [Cyberlindnera jadinii NRRL Y-1542]
CGCVLEEGVHGGSRWRRSYVPQGVDWSQWRWSMEVVNGSGQQRWSTQVINTDDQKT